MDGTPGLQPEVGQWVRVARRADGPGLDTAQVLQVATWQDVPCALLDGLSGTVAPAWRPVDRITEVVR